MELGDKTCGMVFVGDFYCLYIIVGFEDKGSHVGVVIMGEAREGSWHGKKTSYCRYFTTYM